MSADNERRQLDEALAAGQLSAEEYRRRCDALTSQSGGQQSQRTDPFPPAFRWDTTPNETTQYITPLSETEPRSDPDVEDGSEQTQIVHRGAPESIGDSETTQVVPAQPVVPPPPGRGSAPSAESGGWSSTGYQQPFPPAGFPSQGPLLSDNTAPPWANADLPELVPPNWSSGTFPEQDSFSRQPAPEKRRIIVLIGAVMVVAVLATGVALFISRNSNPTTDPTAGPPPPVPTAEPTTSAPPEPYGPLVVPDGEGARTETYSPMQLDEAQPPPLPPPDMILLKQSGIQRARSVIVDDNGTTTSLWAFTASRDPVALQQAMDTDQRRFDYVRAPQSGAGGLPVFTSDAQMTIDGRPIVVFRTHYVSGHDVIRIEAYAEDAATARERFDAVLADQLDHTPPS